MIYRGAPAVCIACGRFVDAHTGDILPEGVRCHACGVRAQIDEHERRRPVVERALDAIVGLFDADRRLPRVHVADAPSSGRVRVQGFARPISDERLTAPFSDRRCLAHSIKQLDLDDDRRVVNRKSRFLDFAVDDGSGLARVDTIGTRARLALPSDHEHRSRPHLFLEGVVVPGQIVEVIGTIVASADSPRMLWLGSRQAEPLLVTSW